MTAPREPSWAPQPKGSITLSFDVYADEPLSSEDLANLTASAQAELDGKLFDLDTLLGTIEVQLGA
jgi:hypothetical protein